MKSRRDIIHVVSYFPPHLGGMENCASKIVEIQEALGYRVSVITSTVGVGKKFINSKKNVHYLKALEIAHTPIFISLFINLLKSDKNSLIHLHVSQAFAPEIVMFAAKLRGIPYIAHIHLDVDASGIFGFLLNPYKKIFLSRVLKNANKIICLSDNQKEFVSKKYDIPLEKITIIPNGVSKEYFVKKIKPNNNSKMLFVGRLSAQKNVNHLINALPFMKHKVEVDIVGDGEKRGEIEGLIKSKGIKNVKLHGVKTGRELIEFYKKADIFTVVSIKEGVSLAMLESLAAGVPIVGLKSDGVTGLIENCGIIVSDRNPKSFAAALDDLLKNPKKLENLSRKSVLHAEKYKWENVVSQIGNLYKKVDYAN